MSERKVLPKPDIPLTPGQIVKLQGVFVLQRMKRRYNGKEVETYALPTTMWIDPCKNVKYYVSQAEYFKVMFIELEYTNGMHIVILRPEYRDKVVYVNALPSTWVRGVEGGLFWYPVPESYYLQVLKEDGNIDREFQKCIEKRRRERRKSKAGSIPISLSEETIEELVTRMSDAMSKAFEEAVKYAIMSAIEYLQQEGRLPTVTEKPKLEVEQPTVKRVPPEEVKARLVAKPYVYDVSITGNTVVVYCDPNNVNDVVKELRDMGYRILSKITAGTITAVKASW